MHSTILRLNGKYGKHNNKYLGHMSYEPDIVIDQWNIPEEGVWTYDSLPEVVVSYSVREGSSAHVEIVTPSIATHNITCTHDDINQIIRFNSDNVLDNGFITFNTTFHYIASIIVTDDNGDSNELIVDIPIRNSWGYATGRVRCDNASTTTSHVIRSMQVYVDTIGMTIGADDGTHPVEVTGYNTVSDSFPYGTYAVGEKTFRKATLANVTGSYKSYVTASGGNVLTYRGEVPAKDTLSKYSQLHGPGDTNPSVELLSDNDNQDVTNGHAIEPIVISYIPNDINPPYQILAYTDSSTSGGYVQWNQPVVNPEELTITFTGTAYSSKTGSTWGEKIGIRNRYKKDATIYITLTRL